MFYLFCTSELVAGCLLYWVTILHILYCVKWRIYTIQDVTVECVPAVIKRIYLIVFLLILILVFSVLLIWCDYTYVALLYSPRPLLKQNQRKTDHMSLCVPIHSPQWSSKSTKMQDAKLLSCVIVYNYFI